MFRRAASSHTCRSVPVSHKDRSTFVLFASARQRVDRANERTPAQLLALGMAPDPTKLGDAGVLQYRHFCEEHLPEMAPRGT